VRIKDTIKSGTDWGIALLGLNAYPGRETSGGGGTVGKGVLQTSGVGVTVVSPGGPHPAGSCIVRKKKKTSGWPEGKRSKRAVSTMTDPRVKRVFEERKKERALYYLKTVLQSVKRSGRPWSHFWGPNGTKRRKKGPRSACGFDHLSTTRDSPRCPSFVLIISNVRGL